MGGDVGNFTGISSFGAGRAPDLSDNVRASG
jgi:hypothetical protein